MLEIQSLPESETTRSPRRRRRLATPPIPRPPIQRNEAGQITGSGHIAPYTWDELERMGLGNQVPPLLAKVHEATRRGIDLSLDRRPIASRVGSIGRQIERTLAHNDQSRLLGLLNHNDGSGWRYFIEMANVAQIPDRAHNSTLLTRNLMTAVNYCIDRLFLPESYLETPEELLRRRNRGRRPSTELDPTSVAELN